MSTFLRAHGRTLGTVLFAILLISAPLLLAPRVTYGQCSTPCPTVQLQDHAPLSILDELKNAWTAVSSAGTAQSTLWLQLKGAVLDPLAHALAQAVLKQITASVVNSINGTNGSPQFVTSLALNLQQVGDQAGLAFIAQFTGKSNSPFAPAIGTALQKNYLQQTSLAGFFSANQCTLTQASPNINSFLGGNFKQGGWTSWFALTTQQQNNPFTLYQKANGQLASVVGAAQANQRQTIAQNNGFLSWCGPYNATITAPTTLSNAANGATLTSTIPNINADGTVTTGTQTIGATLPTTAAISTGAKAQPGPNCTNSDGTPGTVQTPGSVIQSSLEKTLGSGVDSLVSVHDFDQMVDTILSALITKVVSTGLSALSGSPSTPGSFNNSGTATSTDPNAAGTASQATAQAQTVLSSLSDYDASWQTIISAANSAKASVAQLGGQCSGLVSDAQTALNTEINPAIAQGTAAIASASTTAALANQVEADATALNAGTAGAGGAIIADTQTLAAAPPSASDIATADQQASVTGGATSASDYTLTVSGGTLVDQMNLIVKNAQNMAPSCGAPALGL